jgi:hypothetical protein
MSAENHRPAGVTDRGTVQTSMREAAQKAQELRRQAEAARTSLSEAAVKVAELEQQATAAQKVIVLYQEQEGAIARALQDAQRTNDEMMRSAKARAEEMVLAAKSAAEGVTQSARTAAAETLQKARESAQAQLQAAERATASAKTAADEIVQTANATAAETLQKARQSAQEQLQAAERAAAEQLTRARAESEQLATESARKVREAQQAAEQYLSGVTAKLDAFVRDREAMARGLDALAKNHAESLQTMTRLRTEVQSQILPTVHRLLQKLKGEDAGGADNAAPAPAPVSSTESTEPARADAPRDTPPAAAAPEDVAAASESATRYTGEVVVSPIHSFLQATKFMTALSQLKGVASVKLRTYSGAKAAIDVVTEGQPVGNINCKTIDGFAVEIMESNDSKLVLRIGVPAPRPVPG